MRLCPARQVPVLQRREGILRLPITLDQRPTGAGRAFSLRLASEK